MRSPGQYVSFNRAGCGWVCPTRRTTTFPWTETIFPIGGSHWVAARAAGGGSKRVITLKLHIREARIGRALFIVHQLPPNWVGRGCRTRITTVDSCQARSIRTGKPKMTPNPFKFNRKADKKRRNQIIEHTLCHGVSNSPPVAQTGGTMLTQSKFLITIGLRDESFYFSSSAITPSHVSGGGVFLYSSQSFR